MRLPSILRSRRPTLCGISVRGAAYYAWPVRLSVSTLYETHENVVTVVAPTAGDAARLIQKSGAEYIDRPFEVVVVGLRGGVATHLFCGWETLIGMQMFSARRASNAPVQLDLGL